MADFSTVKRTFPDAKHTNVMTLQLHKTEKTLSLTAKNNTTFIILSFSLIFILVYNSDRTTVVTCFVCADNAKILVLQSLFTYEIFCEM